MPFRNWKSGTINHTNVRTSSSNVIQNIEVLTKFCGSRTISLSGRFVLFVLLEQVVVPKTFPEVLLFRVSCGNPESRQGMVLGLGTVES